MWHDDEIETVRQALEAGFSASGIVALLAKTHRCRWREAGDG